jgi:hypothetical protein
VKPRVPGDAVRPAGWFAPTDDRCDPYVTPNVAPDTLAHARRTCCVLGAGAIVRRGDGGARLTWQPYGSFNALCRTEPFWDQPTVLERRMEVPEAFGYTAYLVAPDLLLTCWHGWEQAAGEPQFAVFDYAVRADGTSPTELPPQRVYAISPYPAARAPSPDGAAVCEGDWVLLRLERRVAHLGTLAPTRIAPVQVGRGVYALGHPRGLPVKLASNASVLSAEAGAFRTDLDTYVGNSGSPVFDATTHALVGLVVEAQKDDGDFVPAPALGCYVSNRIERPAPGQVSIDASCFAPALARAIRAGRG